MYPAIKTNKTANMFGTISNHCFMLKLVSTCQFHFPPAPKLDYPQKLTEIYNQEQLRFQNNR